MTVTGTVRSWDDAEGCGVVDSAETPGGCWTHYSHLDMAGYRSVSSGELVQLDWAAPGQDGFDFRAVRVRPADVDPAPAAPTVPSSEQDGAYSSTLTLTFDPPAEP